ncbi:MAG: acyl-CoA dehydrogenase, partial [Nocardioides sp.]
MDFEPSARTRDLMARLQVFMDEHVYPAEAVYDVQVAGSANPHEQPQVMRELQARARERGLWNLFMTHGGWGVG